MILICTSWPLIFSHYFLDPWNKSTNSGVYCWIINLTASVTKRNYTDYNNFVFHAVMLYKGTYFTRKMALIILELKDFLTTKSSFS